MPGWVNLTESEYGAAVGYGAVDAYDNGPSHTSFVIWLLAITVVAIAILGGLSVAGFSFLFKR